MKRKISDKQIKSLWSAEELEMLTKIIEYIVGETLKRLDIETTSMENRLYRLEKEFLNREANND